MEGPYLAAGSIMRLVLEVPRETKHGNYCCPGWKNRKLPWLPVSLQ